MGTTGTRRRRQRQAVAVANRLRIEEREAKLDAALADSFPASDPVSSLEPAPPAAEQPSKRRA